MVEAVIKSELSCFSSNPALVRINLNEETVTVSKLKYEHSIDLPKKNLLRMCTCPFSLPPFLWFISSIVQPGRKFREPTFGFTDHLYFWVFPVISAFMFTSLLVEVLY